MSSRLPMVSDMDSKKSGGVVILREFVSHALNQKSKANDPVHYNYLIQQLHTAEPETLRKWLLALTASVSQITKDFHELVTAIMSYEWLDEETNEVFCGLLLNLNSANTCFLHRTIQKLIRSFIPEKDPVTNVYSEERIRLIHHGVHSALQHLLAIIPSGMTALLPIIEESFPYVKHDIEEHIGYMKAMLDMCSYCTPLRERILTLIVSRVISIDVEIEVDEDNRPVGKDDQNMFLLDEDHDLAGPSVQISLVEKMDAMMEHLLHWITQNETLYAPELFDIFMRVFDNVILTTHKSKYTQFVLFYICRTQRAFQETFIASLLNKVNEAGRDSLSRQICVGYLGSYIARANYLDHTLVRQILTVLVKWLHNYVTVHGNSVPDAESHYLFYTVAQSVLYIVLYHQQSLFSDGRHFFASLRLDVIVEARLNPLKMCSFRIVTEFANVMQTRELIPQISAILERNKHQIRAPQRGQTFAEMESYYPFDPYLLKQSGRFIEPFYKYWSDQTIDDFDSQSIASTPNTTPGSSFGGLGTSLTDRMLGTPMDYGTPLGV